MEYVISEMIKTALHAYFASKCPDIDIWQYLCHGEIVARFMPDHTARLNWLPDEMMTLEMCAL